MPRVVSTSALAALVLTTVWLFWPSGLGGATTYLTTHGISMEPRFHTGDLAVLTRADAYSVGDVIGYESPTLKTTVMHRIVSVDADGFVTQGDNNAWLDKDRPTQDDVLGRLLFRVPHGGAVLGAFGSPGVLFPLAGVALALLGLVHDPRGRRTRRWLERRGRGRVALPVPTMSTRGHARQVAQGAGVVALAAAVGCGVLLSMSPTTTETRTLQVTQTNRFSYSGKALPGTTYPAGTVATGDTVWNRLVEDLTVSATTSITGPELTGVSGVLHLDVVVSAADGWSAVLNSGAAVALENGTATAAVAVDADAAAALLSRHYEETGTTGGAATLTVVGVSETTGTVYGKNVPVEAPPGLAFTLDQTSLHPTSTEPAALAPSTDTPVQVDEVQPRRLTVLAASVPIGSARKIMGAVLLLSLAALCAGAWVGRVGRGDVSGRFLVRHADRILPVTSFSPGATVIDVPDAESLHRVAERFDSMVLHQAGPDEDVFAVRDVDATYRFVVPMSAGRRGGLPPVPSAEATPGPAPADATTPLPRVVPGTLWGQVA